MPETTLPTRPIWGLTGFFVGVAAIALAMAVLNGVFDAPAKSTATVIGEFAAEIRNSARAALNDMPTVPPMIEAGRSGRDIAMLLVPVLAGIAAICGAVGLFRHENRSLPMLAIGAGSAAVVLQFAMWLALLICGVILITSILTSMNGILGFSVFDWFSG
ncbi:hypothetical protein [Cognatishimia sp. MH4019]|uniref:hypothetical protein n=1 Tax=Cognatishimia sp. MH4019 TaxID=2854030 RepID=UPI001CD3A01F|nr:hypothetical protein [Cognatishimia sp. MH4019]